MLLVINGTGAGNSLVLTDINVTQPRSLYSEAAWVLTSVRGVISGGYKETTTPRQATANKGKPDC